MKSAFWRALAVTAIVAMPTLANANDATIGSEAATSSMVGSTLNNTTALFNAWPHLVVSNGNGAEISTSDFSTNNGAGQGRIWWEAYEDMWLNLNVGRRDLGTQSANFLWGGPVSGGFAPDGTFLGGDQGNGLVNGGNPGAFTTGNLSSVQNPWINLGVAMPSGDGAWSANVFFGSESFENKVDDTANGNPPFTDSATGFGGLFSFGNGDGMHVSAELAMLKETDEPAAANTATLEGDLMSLAVNGRLDTDLYIYQASLVYASATTQALDPNNASAAVDTDAKFLGLLANAGRFAKNEVDGQASAEFTFAYGKTEVGDGEASMIVLPGVRVAAWEKLSDRFGVMGGFQTQYALMGAKDVSNAKGFDYQWDLGMFMQPTENVRLDFQFVPGNLNRVLSLGNTAPMVAYLGATVGLN